MYVYVDGMCFCLSVYALYVYVSLCVGAAAFCPSHKKGQLKLQFKDPAQKLRDAILENVKSVCNDVGAILPVCKPRTHTHTHRHTHTSMCNILFVLCMHT